MKLVKPHTLQQISELIKADILGDTNVLMTGINEIHRVESGDLVFVDHPKYYRKAIDSEASIILLNTRDFEVPKNKAFLISDNPFEDYNFLVKHFKPYAPWSIQPSNCSVGLNSHIHPGVIMGDNVNIGDNCIIHSGVVIYSDTVIGNNVIVHPNAVLGNDAFYYNKKNSKYRKMHTCGRLILHSDVEIGAACTISRGVSGDTIIGKGTKLDSQVHVGHDTIIGENCLIAAQVGIAGCVAIEDNAILWGQVGVRSDVKISEGAEVLGQSGVTKSIDGGKTYFGTPIREAREAFKDLAVLRKIIKKQS